jgi:hypothetical protein
MAAAPAWVIAVLVSDHFWFLDLANSGSTWVEGGILKISHKYTRLKRAVKGLATETSAIIWLVKWFSLRHAIRKNKRKMQP